MSRSVAFSANTFHVRELGLTSILSMSIPLYCFFISLLADFIASTVAICMGIAGAEAGSAEVV
jgi:hypothetical protein